ncbi:hypothetical protein Rsub_12955 [Raphidocelis subcapitata]|uniref:C3H1-type domain-containing protein n=1 Tax=Raphidocelis subcapitata TaxID=307507 RepID=A0A2V0PK64_9CHLO|nr:hypothetical protein Rsub_12955 [Raphidocelis subcapitata]|eukprot:GBG00185.1 hypothetical protein Rsub_12955 [Raphidocelis subcapitata]
MNINAYSAAAERLWGGSGVTEDAAKLVLARELLAQMAAGEARLGLTHAQAGAPVAAALGGAWGSARARAAAGKPGLRELVLADPRFTVEGNPSVADARIQLDLKALWESAAGADERGDHPGSPGARLLDPSYWEDLPRRPGAPACGLQHRFGWCVHRAACPFDHPPDAPKAAELRGALAARRQSGAVRFARAGGGGGGGGDGAAPVYPPEGGREPFLRGALAKWLLEAGLSAADGGAPSSSSASASAGGGGCGGGGAGGEAAPLRDWLAGGGRYGEAPPLARSMADAGAHLRALWKAQPGRGPDEKPFKSLGELLADDPHFLQRGASGGALVELSVGGLLSAAVAAGPLLRRLSAFADAIFPPARRREDFLRGALAKHILALQIEGGAADALPPALCAALRGEGGPTPFRLNAPQAGEHARRAWREGGHPWGAEGEEIPFKPLPTLAASGGWFPQEPQPGNPKNIQIAFDAARLIREGPAALRRAAAAPPPAAAAAAPRPGSAGAGAAGGSRPASAAAVSRPGSRGAAAGAAAAGEGSGEGEEEEEEEEGSGDGGESDGAAGSAGGGAGGYVIGGPEEDAALVAVAEAEQSPPVASWRPPGGAPPPAGWGWAEVAVRLLTPPPVGRRRASFDLALARLRAHLEGAEVVAVSVAVYAKHPHLVQLFVPWAEVGGLQLPATVYLIDTIDAEAAAPAIAAAAPALSARGAPLKVAHSSRNWSGLLRRRFGVQLGDCFDTQQAHHVFTQIKWELGRAPQSHVLGSQDVSLSALMRARGFHHPLLARDLGAAAQDARQQRARGGPSPRAAAQTLDAPFLDDVARGATYPDGAVSFWRMAQWAAAGAMQCPPPSHPA